MGFAEEIAALFRRDVTRVVQQVQAFPNDDLLWRVLPGISNSAGNLVLHLEGNLREYVGRQLGGIDYVRQRDAEFSGTGVAAAELIPRMEAVRELVVGVVAQLSESQLEAPFPQNVLGGPMPVRQFLMHLEGHLNYHAGQIDYLRRVLTGASAVKYVGLM